MSTSGFVGAGQSTSIAKLAITASPASTPYAMYSPTARLRSQNLGSVAK